MRIFAKKNNKKKLKDDRTFAFKVENSKSTRTYKYVLNICLYKGTQIQTLAMLKK